MKSRKRAASALGVITLAMSALVLPVQVGTTGQASAVTPTLPKSPAGRVSVLSANAGELLSGADIAEVLDAAHLASRVQAVLNALNSGTPAPTYPNYAPDVVLLQEVTRESTANVVAQLSAATGYTYKIGADALPGTVAWEDKTSTPKIVRETAIAYNSSTMKTVGSSAASLLEHPRSEVPAGQDPNVTWWSVRASTVQLQQLSSGKKYGVYSAHYRPNSYVVHHDEYTVKWTNFLKKRVSELYPGATPIIGGDLNNHNNAYVAAFNTAVPVTSPGSYNVAQPQGSGSVDVIASTDRVLTTNYDYDYKTERPGVPSYFADVDSGPNSDFFKCYYLYDGGGPNDKPGGQGNIPSAKAIQGCNERFYSDHSFVWAVFGP